MPSIWQILIILVIVLLLFGTKKLRNVGGDLGAAIKGFKEGVKGAEEDSKADDAKTIEGEVTEKSVDDAKVKQNSNQP